jgi:hypothetical protein
MGTVEVADEWITNGSAYMFSCEVTLVGPDDFKTL